MAKKKKNWKTTLAGLVLALSMGVANADSFNAPVPSIAKDWANFAAVISAAMLGLSARDGKSTEEPN